MFDTHAQMEKPDLSSIESRLAFAKMTEAEKKLLRANRKRIMSFLPKIMEGYDKHILSFPELAGKFYNDAQLLKHVSEKRIEHIDRILQAKFDDAYMQEVIHVGHVHNRIGIGAQWLVAAHGALLSEVRGAVLKSGSWLKRLFGSHSDALMLAVNKAFFLDLELIISSQLYDAKREKVSALDQLSNKFHSSFAEIVKELTGQSDGTSQMAQSMSAATKTLAASFEESGDRIEAVSSHSGKVAGIVRDAGEQVERLQERVQKISDSITKINTIANQTNLLALNAAIEASRAGAAGKGFAVVATEVKELATQTSRSTSEISERIEEIQAETLTTSENFKRIFEEISAIDSEISAASSGFGLQNKAASVISEKSRSTSEVVSNLAHELQILDKQVESFLNELREGGDF